MIDIDNIGTNGRAHPIRLLQKIKTYSLQYPMNKIMQAAVTEVDARMTSASK